MAKRRNHGTTRTLARAQAVTKSSGNAPMTPPRIVDALTGQGMDNTANLGPGAPLRPYQGYSQPPRATDYPVGVNISTRGRESWSRISFDTIRALIDAYDVARMCINHKIDELRSMPLMFEPWIGQKDTAGIDEALEAAGVVLEVPDREHPYDEWVSLLLENALRYDALPLYRRRNLGGQVIGLEVLDGTTITPYIDEHGRRPRPPAPAFYQMIKGLPWNWYTTDDIDYRRFRPQVDSPYGLAPIETILLTANTDIRFQWHFLQMFTDGSVPAGFIELPPDISSPDQVAEWQDYWDAMILGDQAKLHQLIAVPNGTKIQTYRPDAFSADFPEYLMARTCAAYGVTPQDLGLVKDVNRANGETQVDIQFRVNTLPWVIWLQGILTRHIRSLGLPVQVKLDTGRDKEDRLAVAQAWQVYIDSGMASADEGRQEILGLPIDSARPVPRFINNPRTGPVPLQNILSIAGRIDPDTGAPVDDEPLDTTPFEGAEGVLADKAPGGTQFKRAPIDPDEPQFPQLEKPVPGSDVLGTKPGTPVIGDPGVTPDSESQVAKAQSGAAVISDPVMRAQFEQQMRYATDRPAAERHAFTRFVKARLRTGKWRDFDFEQLPPVEAHRLNNAGRAQVRKAAGELIAAGLAVRATDTGRVLMLQRGLDPEDAAAGTWEFPGGHIEDGETAFAAACREWQEETGCLLPADSVADACTDPAWQSADGVYAGFVIDIPAEAALDIRERGRVSNPDDPDGDVVEAVAWWNPALLVGNPAIRAELAADLDRVTVVLTPPSVAGECEGQVVDVGKARGGTTPPRHRTPTTTWR